MLAPMLSVQENEYLARTGPGTPMGELFRRFIEPFAAGHPEAYRVSPLDVVSPEGDLARLLERHYSELEVPA